VIIVHDANILIDLFEAGLIKSFFSLGFENHTTDIILREVEQPIQQYVQAGMLQCHVLTAGQLDQIFKILISENGVSLPDCSALWLTQKLGSTAYLLSGDGKLRQCAKNRKIKVHGLLWVFDQFVEKEIIPMKTMSAKLQKLLNQGSRLPIEECQKRISQWAH
jgi:hypothetical protein